MLATIFTDKLLRVESYTQYRKRNKNIVFWISKTIHHRIIIPIQYKDTHLRTIQMITGGNNNNNNHKNKNNDNNRISKEKKLRKEE